VSSVKDLGSHPQVRRTTIGTDKGEVSLPALGEHSDAIRAEFK
jgi:hypothetical protein